MNQKILDHYLKFSTYTYPGCYQEFLKFLPDEIPKLCKLVRSQIIHRVTLRNKNTKANWNKKYGDLEKYPWHKLRCDDDVLLTAISMIAELLRQEEKISIDRKVENKIVVTCRYTAVLITSILKSKGIPTRCRSGFAPYIFPPKSYDHWICQYWNKSKQQWINIDADMALADDAEINQFDFADREFDWAGKTWLDIRAKKVDGEKFVYADGKGTNGLRAVIRAVFYDFHSLMNNEISYLFQPNYIANKFDKLTKKDFLEIDELAKLLLDPDKNFEKLLKIWNTKKKFRVLNSPLVNDRDE